MNIYAVTSDKKELSRLRTILEDISPDTEISCHDDPLSALAKAREGAYPDVAFLRLDMPELGGLDLGRYLKELYPFVNVIIISDDREAAYDAMKLRASGYVISPFSGEDVRDELNELRYRGSHTMKNRVYIQTFGDFEIFVDGEPVAFKYTRTKEVVAVLVNNRGAQTTNGEIIASLWEDDGDPEKKLSYLRNLRQDLQNTLTRLNLEGLIIKQRGSMSIVPDRVECDLYDWLDKKKESRYQYTGDYMNQYSWPEFFHAELDEISYQLYGE
ncbi:MAG: response regulator [Lachnospiraceae bacterium]|nr:response regulator [Lachnospiraceae bacterium]